MQETASVEGISGPIKGGDVEGTQPPSEKGRVASGFLEEGTHPCRDAGGLDQALQMRDAQQ